MKKFLNRLTKQSRIKKLKLELRETMEQRNKQIFQNLKQDKQMDNLAKKMRELTELASINKMTIEYAEDRFKKLLDAVAMEYGNAHQSRIKVVNSANKMQKMIDKINRNSNVYGKVV